MGRLNDAELATYRHVYSEVYGDASVTKLLEHIAALEDELRRLREAASLAESVLCLITAYKGYAHGPATEPAAEMAWHRLCDALKQSESRHD